MTTGKDYHQKPQTKLSKPNPLADIAGKFGGEFWLDTQSEIDRSRTKDRKELELELKKLSDKEN